MVLPSFEFRKADNGYVGGAHTVRAYEVDHLQNAGIEEPVRDYDGAVLRAAEHLVQALSAFDPAPYNAVDVFHSAEDGLGREWIAVNPGRVMLRTSSTTLP